MTVIDLHPDDLLDKDARGQLSDDERTRLHAHLARCSACRAEKLLRADFAEELEGEDRPSALLDLVQSALAANRAAAPTEELHERAAARGEQRAAAPSPERAERDVVPRLRRRPGRTTLALLAAAAVLVAGVASATGLTSRVWRSLGAAQELTHASPATTATAADGAPKASPLGTTSHAAPPSAEAAPPSAEAAPPPPRVDVAPSRLEAASRAQAASPIARTTNVAVALGGPAPAPGVPSAIASASASDLFDSANSARRVGDTALALARYDALERQFPESRESRLARATTGKLLLDRGDAVGALGRFDAYLASGAAELREEAMAGRATALERLGRDDEEARAWTALLASFPRTPYAAHARVRVGRSLPQ